MSIAQQPAEGRQEPLLITADQLAVWLQVSVRSLWRLRSAGQIPPPVRLRKAVRWRLADIEDWLAKGCPAQPDETETRRNRRAR
jgi:predicted DNA-binding transcriptional regulator AlpA